MTGGGIKGVGCRHSILEVAFFILKPLLADGTFLSSYGYSRRYKMASYETSSRRARQGTRVYVDLASFFQKQNHFTFEHCAMSRAETMEFSLGLSAWNKAKTRALFLADDLTD